MNKPEEVNCPLDDKLGCICEKGVKVQVMMSSVV